MGFDNRIGNKPPDPYEGYRAEAIEREKHEKEKGKKEEGPPPPKKPPFAALLLALFYKLISLFESQAETEAAPHETEALASALLSLKEAFLAMQKGDKSQDIPFLNRLSTFWHTALEEALYLDRQSLIAHQMRQFFHEIERYPMGKSHTLAYYLTEYAGQTWLPFPYMELIQQLHREHLQTPQESHLAEWVQRLDALTLLLNR